MPELTADLLSHDADLLKAVAHPIRLAILETLAQSEECVCHLSYLLERPQSYVSKQLAELREAGLVIDRREGMRVHYSLADAHLNSLLEDVRALTGRKALLGRRSLAGCPCPRCE